MHGTSAGAPVTLSGYGGLVTLAKPESVPEGASPRTYDGDHDVGSWKTRPGLTNVYATVDATVGPNLPSEASSSTWQNPDNILAEDGSFTTQTPVNIANTINVQDFAFDIPTTSGIAGIEVIVTGYANAPCNLTAQLLVAGVPVGNIKTLTLPSGNSAITFGSLTDLWGNFLTPANLNSLQFGVQFSASSSTFPLATAFLDAAAVKVGVSTGTSNFQFIAPFVAQNGDVKNFSMDADGNFYVEDVTNNPGVQTLLTEGITPGSYAVGINGSDVEYVAFTNLRTGSDMPAQYTPNWVDRITQVGPGASPIFAAQQASSDSFNISQITQPPPAMDQDGHDFYGGIYFLQSEGPGSTSPGNVVTIYYGDVEAGSPLNSDLVTAFNSGQPVYIYLTVSGTPVGFGPLTVQVTNAPAAPSSPPGQPRQFYYFTFVVPTTNFVYYQGSGHPGYEAAWNRTLATMIMAEAVPGLTVGSQVTIIGVTPTGWNNLWTISQALNSSEMVITETSVTSGVATYTYNLTGGSTAPPVAGQLVTITGTTNADGQLNLASATIVSATGGISGSFTVNVPIAINFPTVAEDGQATTAGTIFCFDPGAGTLGTATNPIFGTGTGGSLTFGGSGQFIAVGTKQGTVFFITRNGYYTAPGPPVTFTIPANSTGILATQIPIGPPNVIARAIAFTESGQNGTPGANFFTIPTPVQYIVNDTTYTATSLFINDNTTTSATFFFTDSVLLNALAIDVYGYNLFNQIEIGDPSWIINYSTRNWYGGCWNKVQNFNNLSFDGGYLPATKLVPLGWTQPDAFGALVVSPKFGDAYYIANNGLTLAIIATQMTSGTATYTYIGTNNPSAGDPVIVTGTTNGSGIFNGTFTIASVNISAGTFTVTGLSGTFGSQAETGSAAVTGTLPVAGLITQTAFQDTFQVPILKANTAYSVRVQCSNPSGNHGGNLVIALVANGITYGSFTLSLASMQTSLSIFTGTLLVNEFTTVPSALQFQISATALSNGADVLIDRVEVYPTAIPVLTTTVYGSYAGLLEQVDAVTGAVGFTSENQQPVNGAMVMYDTFYGLKAWGGKTPGSSLYSLQSSPNLEPAQWQEPEVAQRSGGAIGPLAFDLAEQWFVAASRPGLYLFMGGQPGKIMQEIYQVWDAINWTYGNTIWVKVDITHRRMYIGVPLPTPNFWLPNAPVNANPTSPNVILMCNFQGLDSGQEVKSAPQMHTTMFGTLNAIDMRRKWSIWQIPTPYANFVAGPEDEEFYICNGRGNSKVYKLDPTTETDDGLTIDSLYTTAGLVEIAKRQQTQGVGSNRMRWGYMTAALQSSGNIQTTLYPNQLLGPGTPPAGYNAWTLPGGFTPGNPALNDAEAPLNFAATRTFVEFRESDGHSFSLSNLVLSAKKDPWNALRGAK